MSECFKLLFNSSPGFLTLRHGEITILIKSLHYERIFTRTKNMINACRKTTYIKTLTKIPGHVAPL